MSQTQNITEEIPWDAIVESILSDKFAEAFAQIPVETLEFASNNMNKKFITQSVFKSLQEKNPETASIETAEEIADKLIEYAKLQLEKTK